MAIIKAISSKASIGRAINYVTMIEKTDNKLVTGIGCNAESVIDEMEVTKRIWGKTGGRTYKHFVQSFHAAEKIVAEVAHELAIEWVKKCKIFDGFECLVATHQDKEHIHSHIIVNSVNFETGKKFNMKKSDLAEMKDICNQLTYENGLSVPVKGLTFDGEERETVTAWNRKVYEDLQSEKDWRYELADKVLGALESRPTSQAEYEEELAELGVGMKIRGKTVTYFELENENHRMRDNKIEQYFNEKMPLGKEQLDGCFEKNAEIELVEYERELSENREFEEYARELERRVSQEKREQKREQIAAELRAIKAHAQRLAEERERCELERRELERERERSRESFEEIEL